MGCPEWEDADFKGKIVNQFFPKWNSINLNGFKRPKWFVQGPLRTCIYYLIAKRKGKMLKAGLWWNILQNLECVYFKQYLQFKQKLPATRKFLFGLRGKNFHFKRLFSNLPDAIYTTLVFFICFFLKLVNVSVKIIKKLSLSLLELLRFQHINSCEYNFDHRVNQLVEIFTQKFPNRVDKLKRSDLEAYRYDIPLWYELFSYYDIIQAYATDPIIPLLTNNRPYIGFEHGTLRDFTMCDSAVCRNTTLAYNLADRVFITNGDCLEYAQKIGVTNFTPMLHPIDEERIRSFDNNYDHLHEKMGVKYIFLCTLRHDWKVKGTDIYIRALPRIKEAIGKNFILIMTEWGTQVSESKALASELGVSDLIKWVEPLHRHNLFKMLKSADILFDQIALPHFGATAPEGIAAGIPVIMSYDPNSTSWIIPEPAPILSAWNEEQVAENVKYAINPEWLKEYRIRAENWIDKCHSSRIVIEKHVETYIKILKNST